MTAATYPVCHRETIPENGARGFAVETPEGARDLLLVRLENQVYAYINRCPHTGVNLDWVPDRFLDSSGQFLQCATHGALFRMHDGFCIHGPCANQSLQSVPLEERDGELLAVL